jgi:P-type E1-E2 ATPase
VVKNPAVLEQIDKCSVGIFDKTGTLTYGEPKLTDQITANGFSKETTLALAAGLELYSKHPLARAILAQAKAEDLQIPQVQKISEPPGQGLSGSIAGHKVQIISRNKLRTSGILPPDQIPPHTGGLECFIIIDGCYAATYRFHDAPRSEGFSFVRHLRPKHRFDRIMIVSGDRESEVRYLAEQVGVAEVHARQTPEQKLEIVKNETAKKNTAYIGDGINDAPAMTAATVGIAIGAQNSDITAEAADVVVMDGALKKVDEFIHISHRMRSIALQSAVGGMLLSLGGMGFAAVGLLTPVAGAIAQEIIDVIAVLNALRAALAPKEISDI